MYFHEKEKNRRGRKNMFITLCIFMRTRKIGGEEEKKYVYHIVYFHENEKNRRRGRKKYVYHIVYFYENEKNRSRGREKICS